MKTVFMSPKRRRCPVVFPKVAHVPRQTNIKEAISAYLESLQAHGDPVPPSIYEEVVEVNP